MEQNELRARQVLIGLLCFWLCDLAIGFKAGAPLFTCKTMTPGHGVSQQSSPSPYLITPLNAQDVDGRVRVQISAQSPPGYFVGFLLQARPAATDDAIGSFIKVPDEALLLDCGSLKNSAVTHRDDRRKKTVVFDWEAPPDYKGTVTFVGTIVFNYTTFWIHVESLPVEIGKTSSDESPREDLKQLKAAESSLYMGCGVSKNCVSSTEGCMKAGSCEAAVAVSSADGAYQIEMFAKGSKYVATGLSDDNIMGGDSVFECLPESGLIRAYRSWNVPNRKQNTRIEDQSGFSLVNGLYSDGVIYCKLRVDPVFTTENQVFDLNNQKYYILLVAGRETHQNGVGYHDVIYTTSRDKRKLADLEPVRNEDAFYDGCNVMKNCFGAPAGCISYRNCRAATAITVQGDRYTIEMQVQDAAYVATGFSKDRIMGGDSVVECVKEENNRVKAYLSYNVPQQKNNTRMRSQGIVTLDNSTIVEGKMYCAVSHEPTYTLDGQAFDFKMEEYVLLLAAGSSLKPNGVGYHDIVFTASAEKRALSNVDEFSVASKTLLHLHGSFMIIAWIGTASLGLVLARYFKQTWVGSSLCGKDIWFAWHRFFMLLTWLLTLSGVIIMYIEVGGFATGPSQTHALLGAIAAVLTFIQPIGAAFRPHPDSNRRPIFNWMHWFIGNAAHIIAIVTLFLAVDLGKAQLPGFTDSILACYVAIYVLIHLVLSISGCMSDKSGSLRISSMPMKEMNARGPPHQQQYERKKDAVYSGFRKLVFTVYFLIIVAVTALLVYLVVCAPVTKLL